MLAPTSGNLLQVRAESQAASEALFTMSLSQMLQSRPKSIERNNLVTVSYPPINFPKQSLPIFL